MDTLKHKTFQGLRWNFQAQLITQLFNFLVGIILMRLLAPEDFGKFAMVLVVFSFLQIFRDAGLTQAIIQNKDLNSRHSSSAFWFHLFLAATIGFLLSKSGGLFEHFYASDDLSPIAFWLAMDFIIGSFGIVPQALLKKELRFKLLFRIQLAGILISSIVGIYMALTGWGYYSLIGKLLIWTIITSFGPLLLAAWKPFLQFSRKAFRELINFGIPVTGNHLLSFLVRNSDDFFIGKVIGANALGLYNRAYALMLLPMGNITSVLQTVLLSSWSKMQDDKEAIRNMYLKVIGIIALIAFPIMSVLAVLSTPILQIVFGDSWVPMADTLSILSIVGMFQSVGALIGIIFMVFNKNKLLFSINLFSSIFTIVIVVSTIYYFKSIEAAALAYGITSLLLIYPTFYFGGKILGASFFQMIQPIIQPFLMTIAIALCTWLSFAYLPISIPWLRLLITLIIILFIYLATNNIFQIKAWRDLKIAYLDFKKMPNE